MAQHARRDTETSGTGLTPISPEELALASSSMTKLLLTPQEAANALGINRTTLYQLIMRKDIPSLTIGRRRYIPVHTLEAWIASQLIA